MYYLDEEAKKFQDEGRAILREARKVSWKLEKALSEVCSTRHLDDAAKASATVGQLKDKHNFGALLADVRKFVEEQEEWQGRSTATNPKQQQRQPTAAGLRSKWTLAELGRVKMAIYHSMYAYASSLEDILITRGRDGARQEVVAKLLPASSPVDWVYMLDCLDKLNVMVRDDPAAFNQYTVEGSDGGQPVADLLGSCQMDGDDGLVRVPAALQQCAKDRWLLLHENTFPQFGHHLAKHVSSSRILRSIATERAWPAARWIARSVLTGFDRRSIELASEEFRWLSIPEVITPTATSLSGVYPLLMRMGLSGPADAATSGKDKAGDGEGDDGAARDQQLFQQNSGSSKDWHKAQMEDLVVAEELFLSDFLNILSRVPGLSAKAVLRLNKEDTARINAKQRISKSVRQRMAEYYHNILWQAVGELVELSVLWETFPADFKGQSNFYHAAAACPLIPLALQHPRLSLGICSLIQRNLYAQLGDSYASLVFPSMQLLVESLSIHAVAISWDLQFLTCLAETSRLKSAIIEVSHHQPSGEGMNALMTCGTRVSRTGKLFYDTIKSMSRMNNRCHPDMILDFVEHGSHDPEEFPFVEEIQALRRLEATLCCLRNWAGVRSNSTLHGWQVKEFLLITQCDLSNIINDTFDLLQLSDHDLIATSKAINVQFFCHAQSQLAGTIRSHQQTIRGLPAKLMEEMSFVCRTLCLATLRNVFPGAGYWAQSLPAAVSSVRRKPSKYVAFYIDKVLAPVLEALFPMKVEIQQNVGRIILKTFCDAWLEHITNNKIKFSESGAHQISHDFGALRDWIGANKSIREEARRYLLLLDSIRRCEGVARLLLSKPGELIHVKPAKNRVVPITTDLEMDVQQQAGYPPSQGTGVNSDVDQRAESPVEQILDAIPAELYVPNQQEWISLKKNSKILPPFCCK